MLVSVNLRAYQPNDILSIINNALANGGCTIESETGIYLCPHHNFGNDILNAKDDYFDFKDEDWFSPYGVCDTIEQVKEKYAKWLDSKDLNFCISFTNVVKSEQSESRGWRWHKWGEYI